MINWIVIIVAISTLIFLSVGVAYIEYKMDGEQENISNN